jgi:hypothetical protein
MANEDENLSPGQKMIMDRLRKIGGPIDASRFAFASYFRDIEDLGAEELQEIPRFLLDPWLAARGPRMDQPEEEE